MKVRSKAAAAYELARERWLADAIASAPPLTEETRRAHQLVLARYAAAARSRQPDVRKGES